MFRINCPHCGSELEVQEEWQGMATTCPVCGKGLQIPPPPVPGAPGKKKWVLPVIIGGAAVVVAAAAVIILMPEKEKESVPEVVESVDTRLRAAFRAESPDIGQLAELISQASNPSMYHDAFVKEFDRQYGKSTSPEARMKLYEASEGITWHAVVERRERFRSEISGDFRNAIAAFDFATVKKLYPIARKLGDKQCGQGKILIDAEPVLLRRDPAEIRKFIAACPDPYMKERLENRMKVNFHHQVSYLRNEVRKSLAMGNLPEAEKQFAELAAIAPDDKETAELRQILEKARKSPRASANADRSSAPRHPGAINARRGGFRNPHARGGRQMPLHIQLNRACLMGQREEVRRLMAQKPDLHQTIAVMDSATGKTNRSTVFQSLLKRGKNMTGSRGDAFRACLIVILESGFKPNASEQEYMKENYPDLVQFIR